MKTTRSLSLLLAAGAALITNSALAQTWQTVDDFQYYVGGGNLNGANCVLIGPAGRLFVGGWARDTNGDPGHALINVSSDNGATWSITDDFSSGALWTTYDGLAADGLGNLYASGHEYYPPGSPVRWISFVRRSQDGGLTWATVDAFSSFQVDLWKPSVHVATDAFGNVYVVSNAKLATTNNYWIVRKSADGGNSWQTVDTFNAGPAAGRATGVVCDPTAGVFVSGSGDVTVTVVSGKKTYTTTQHYWYVRRSLDGGATWTTVDAYADANAYPRGGLGTDGSGNIYVAGDSNPNWLVRKGANGGTSWSITDAFQPCITTSIKPLRTQCYGAGAYGLGADSSGNVLVVGWAEFGTGTTWTARQNPSGTSVWQLADAFEYVPGQAAYPSAVAADPAGHFYVVGYAWDATGGIHWIVRKN